MERVARCASLFIIALCGLTGMAFANGIVDIRQPQSFPIVISRSGSYRLVSNLVVPDGVDAIDITAPDVTLDLNGFTIRGPVTCTGEGFNLSCSGGSSGNGIVASDRQVKCATEQ